VFVTQEVFSFLPHTDRHTIFFCELSRCLGRNIRNMLKPYKGNRKALIMQAE